ncbi:MAG: TA system VapC family ribonuclease toxin [Candidatus Limnocylindrales bacterium]
MPDVNVLVYAHRQDEVRHGAYRAWFEATVDGPESFALSVLVAVGFVRVVTNPHIFPDPTPLSVALATVERLADHPRCRLILPGEGHLAEVARLCRATGAIGKRVADAQHAAVAIAEGATWVSADGDFAAFSGHGLRWQHLVLD